MKKPVKIVLGILGGILAFIIIICVVIFSILNKQKNADFYDLKTDKIVSVKAVVGTRDIAGVSTSISNGISTKTYQYKSDNSTEDINQYLTFLVENEGFIETVLNQNDSKPVYAKKSNDEGKLIILSITDTGFGYTITIQKGEGTLTTTD